MRPALQRLQGVTRLQQPPADVATAGGISRSDPVMPPRNSASTNAG